MEHAEKADLLKQYGYMLTLVKCAVNGMQAPAPPQGIHWNVLYKLAKDNCFAAMLYPVLQGPVRPPQEIYANFLQAYRLSVAKDLTQQYELEKILAFCETEQIKNIPLKGCVLKKLYPHSYMRFMGDIDLWVDKDGIKKLGSFLVQEGYKPVGKMGIYDEYQKPPYMALEVHKKLVIDENKAARFFNEEVLCRVIKQAGSSYSYQMTPEDFYLHLTDHAVKHFYGSGITPRMLLDFYILKKTDSITSDRKALDTMLETLGLKTFEHRVSALSDAWFAPGGTGLLEDPFSLYVLQNGSFGRRKNTYIAKTARETREEKAPSKARFVLRRLFPTYTMLKGKFSILEKAPVLTPVMYFPWWVTWFDTLFVHKRLDYKALKHINDIDEESTRQLRTLYKEMGLDYRR